MLPWNVETLAGAPAASKDQETMLIVEAWFLSSVNAVSLCKAIGGN